MGFDLFIGAILLITTIRGAAKGVAWQLAGIGALVLCFFFATPLSLTVAPMIKLNPPLNRWVAMLGIYLVFAFGTFVIARGFREALEKAKFVEFDRHLGALFGLLKGAVIALVITFFSVAMSAQAREYILTTYTGYASAHIMNALDPVMPRELHAILEPYIHGLDEVDPELQRNRHEFHEELQGDAGTSANSPRSGVGYRPTKGEGTERVVRDPFEDDDQGNSPAATDPFNSPPSKPPSLADEAEQFLRQIPTYTAKVAPTIKKQLLQALQNTISEHRDEFAQQLGQADTPEKLSSVARAWQNGRPVRKPTPTPRINDGPLDLSAPFSHPNQNPSRPPPRVPARPPVIEDEDPIAQPAVNPQQRGELLQGIAKIFSSQPAKQAKKMTEIETMLLGLPDSVVVGVLGDWLSDLRGDDPDPDPQTDVATGLNIRVARQIETLRIPRTKLPPEWQTQLDGPSRN